MCNVECEWPLFLWVLKKLAFIETRRKWGRGSLFFVSATGNWSWFTQVVHLLLH
ncbi:hypothetical protein RchiOBHm_Chr2g0151121 [Rosa chinensis]|uniref:Uncharacterized protein n=1 Tax=Rosa chinensis TaxID=74649 RepID=A0A2P6S010_ROSCH|nr:hypothetical protein RchiOBHm_Chr2g0151121 [Rosa chinensis]